MKKIVSLALALLMLLSLAACSSASHSRDSLPSKAANYFRANAVNDHVAESEYRPNAWLRDELDIEDTDLSRGELLNRYREKCSESFYDTDDSIEVIKSELSDDEGYLEKFKSKLESGSYYDYFSQSEKDSIKEFALVRLELKSVYKKDLAGRIFVKYVCFVYIDDDWYVLGDCSQ